MDKDSLIIKDAVSDMIVYNPDNYSYILKKSEKVACAVFYITKSIGHNDLKSPKVVSYIEDTAQKAFDCVLETLTLDERERSMSIRRSVRELLRLETALQMGLASGLLQRDHTEVLTREIEDILRNLHKLDHESNDISALRSDIGAVRAQAAREQQLRKTAVGRKEKPGIGRASRVNTTSDTAAHMDRRAAIRSVLQSKGQASIKDISDIVTDCSEKTIQRELIAMIKDGLVSKTGERRWSRYSYIGV